MEYIWIHLAKFIPWNIQVTSRKKEDNNEGHKMMWNFRRIRQLNIPYNKSSNTNTTQSHIKRNNHYSLHCHHFFTQSSLFLYTKTNFLFSSLTNY